MYCMIFIMIKLSNIDKPTSELLRSKSKSYNEWFLWMRKKNMYYIETRSHDIAIASYSYLYNTAYLQIFYSDSKSSTHKIITDAFKEVNNTFIIVNSIISLKKFKTNCIKNILKRSYDEYDDYNNRLYDIKDLCLCIKNSRPIKNTINTRIKIGATKGYYEIKNNFNENNDILWDIVDIDIYYDDLYFMINWNKPLAMFIRNKYIKFIDDISIVLVWNNVNLIWGSTRWNKIANFTDHYYDTPDIVDKNCLDWKPMGTILISSGFNHIHRYYNKINRYHDEWYHLTNALAFMIVKKNNAIKRIQRQFKKSLYNPIYIICRKRLYREFLDLNIKT